MEPEGRGAPAIQRFKKSIFGPKNPQRGRLEPYYFVQYPLVN